jgi:hypothetical protein
VRVLRAKRDQRTVHRLAGLGQADRNFSGSVRQHLAPHPVQYSGSLVKLLDNRGAALIPSQIENTIHACIANAQGWPKKRAEIPLP